MENALRKDVTYKKRESASSDRGLGHSEANQSHATISITPSSDNRDITRENELIKLKKKYKCELNDSLIHTRLLTFLIAVQLIVFSIFIFLFAPI